MCSTTSISRPATPRSCGPDRGQRGFSLVEVVIATGVISFALISILGVMSLSLVTHQDSGVDSVLTLMSESALQEMNNVGFSTLYTDAGASTTATGTEYYIYFDANGQITADNSSTSYELSTAKSGAATTVGTPLTAALTTYPANTVYQCTAYAVQTTLPGASATSSSVVNIVMVFTWPVGSPSASTIIQNLPGSLNGTSGTITSASHVRVVTSSIYNPN